MNTSPSGATGEGGHELARQIEAERALINGDPDYAPT
jgi:hypothetical protein